MKLTGLHFLTTYQCTLECNHCFAWGSPWQTGTMTAADIDYILDEAQKLGTIKSIYYEGGEAGLYYTTLVHAVRGAADRGFSVGLVTNAFWAISERDALDWLTPFVGLLDDLSVSDDLYHWQEQFAYRIQNAQIAAVQLGIPIDTITIAQPETIGAISSQGKLPGGQSAVMYRGRAASMLAGDAVKRPLSEYTTCPYENLVDPGRVHVDPLGYLHICQGISIGNIFQSNLREIVESYDPQKHPISGPLNDGGPAELVARYELSISGDFADACHLCDTTRRALRERFPAELAPDQMYGVVS